MLHKRFAVLTLALLAAGCTTGPDHGGSHIASAHDQHLSEVERRAYAEGVREVMQDMAGKLRAQKRFVYEPSIQTCGVRVPGRVANGSYIPPHETCVMESRGRFIERSPVVLPELGGGK